METEDKLAFLDGESEAVEAVETPAEPEIPVEQVEAETKPDQPRDEGGRFAVKPADEPKSDPVMVPIQALHETRDKVRDLEAKLSQFEQPAPVETPDVFEDPKGFQSHLEQQFEQRLYQHTLNVSHRFAVQQHGKEAVDAAVEWGRQRCAADSHFNAQVFSSPDPINFAVEQYQREQIASQVDPGEFQQFQAWKAAQAQAQQEQPAASAGQPTPPRSLASVPASGGLEHVPTGPGQAFDTLFT